MESDTQVKLAIILFIASSRLRVPIWSGSLEVRQFLDWILLFSPVRWILLDKLWSLNVQHVNCTLERFWSCLSLELMWDLTKVINTDIVRHKVRSNKKWKSLVMNVLCLPHTNVIMTGLVLCCIYSILYGKYLINIYVTKFSF